MMKRVILISIVLTCAALAVQASSSDTLEHSDQTTEPMPERTIEIEFLQKGEVKFSNIRTTEGLILMDAKINGRTGICLIDTGSDVTIVDSNLGFANDKSEKSDSISLEGWRGSVAGRVTNNIKISVGDQLHINGNMISVDLSKLQEALKLNVIMVLGKDVLEETAFILDLKRDRMFFAPSGKLRFDPSGWDSSAMKNGSIEGFLNQKLVTLKIDTGMTTPFLIFENHKNRIFGDSLIEPLFQSIDATGSKAQDFGLKNITWKFESFEISSYVEISPKTNNEIHGYAGVEFFKGKVSVLDFPNEEIFIKRKP